MALESQVFNSILKVIMLQDVYEKMVSELLRECKDAYGPRLVSFCVFGSVGRQTMNPTSDIDLLIVADPLPEGRVRRVEEFQKIERRLRSSVEDARVHGVFIEFSPVIKTPSEVAQGSPLFLDMLEDGRIVFDKGRFLAGYFEKMRRRLQAQGARRVFHGDSWYWILKEPYNVGEEIEL